MEGLRSYYPAGGFDSPKVHMEKKTDILGTPVPEEELVGLFPAPEGELNLYYGQIGSGKTYGATADIWEQLRQGRLVYATWPIHFKDHDDRDDFWYILKNLLLFKKRFYQIPLAKNFHFIDAEKGELDGVPTWNPSRPSEYIAFLNSLNHCVLYIDEAWRVIDSYQGTNFSLESRNLILVTRHKFRTINLIAQRPTSVQVTARANVNRFYKFVKIGTWPVPRFARYEFQEMSGETVNEEAEPISTKRYWGKKKVFQSYNSYFYGTLDPLHALNFKAFDLALRARLHALWSWIVRIYAEFREKISNRWNA